MKPIAIFYHALFQRDHEILPAAIHIVHEQMADLRESGLLDAASEIVVGINGGDESRVFCETLLPEKAEVYLHGLQCKNECRTIRLIEEWLPTHRDWHVLYFHAKGCTHPIGDKMRTDWRYCMMYHLVSNWSRCVSDLAHGYDVAGCHWMTPPKTPPKQYIFAGNFFWAKASFLSTLPSISSRARIAMSGIDSMESRFESEVWIGNGPRRPIARDYHPGWTVSTMPH